MESGSKASGTWTIAALGSALLASLCCIGPIVVGALGIGALGAASALESLRPYLLGLTGILIGAGFYWIYRKRTVVCFRWKLPDRDSLPNNEAYAVDCRVCGPCFGLLPILERAGSCGRRDGAG